MSASWVVRRLLFSTVFLLLSLHAVLCATGSTFLDAYLALLFAVHAFFFELEAHPSNDGLVQLVYPISLAAAWNAAALTFASISGTSKPHNTWQWVFLLIIPPLPLLLHCFFLFWRPLRSEVQRAYRLRAGHRVWLAIKIAWALLAPLALYLVLLRWGGQMSPAHAAGLAPKSTAFLGASLAAHALAALAFALVLLSHPLPASTPSSPSTLASTFPAGYNERTPLITPINATDGETGVTLTLSPPSPVSATPGLAATAKKRPKRLPASAVPPDAPLTVRLEALLVSPPEYEIVSELMSLTPPDSLLRSLVVFFDSRHAFMRLLKTFLLRDIRAAPTPESLLRDDGPAARLYQTYVALAAPSFLAASLAAPFGSFYAWAETLHAEGAAPSTDLSALAMHANSIVIAYMHAIDSLPSAIRKVCRATHKGSTHRFGASAEHVSTNLLFLHLLCRALVFPEQYTLLASPPDAAIRQAFLRPLSRLVYLASVFDTHPAPLDDPLMALVTVQLSPLPAAIHSFAVAARETPPTAPKARLVGPVVDDAASELLRYVSANYGLLKRHLEEEA